MAALRRMMALLIALALNGPALAARPADLLFIGGPVITADAGNRIANGVAVEGNRIVAVGDVAAWRGPKTRVINLKGRALLPGFIDSHSHVSGMANVEANYINIQAPPLANGQAIIARLKAAQASRPKGAWLIGQGTYNQIMPTRAELDAAFPDTPVDLQWSVHDHLINHAAAVALGMGRDFPDPPAGSTGRYERTADGEVMISRDAPIKVPLPTLTEAQLKQGVQAILRDFYLQRGVTTVSDMSEPAAYKAYDELRAEGRLPTRVRLNYLLRTPAELDRLIASGLATGRGDDWLRTGAVKFIQDGVWGTTAAVYRPFWEGSATSFVPNNRGGTSFDQPTLSALVLKARQAGWQVQIHANGDRAQD